MTKTLGRVISINAALIARHMKSNWWRESSSMTRISTLRNQLNWPSDTSNSSLLIIFEYIEDISVIILFLRYSDCSSLDVSEEPEWEDSKWYLICPFLGWEGRGFWSSAFIEHIIWVSSSPKINWDDPNPWGTAPSWSLKFLYSSRPLPSRLQVFSLNPSRINARSGSLIYDFI